MSVTTNEPDRFQVDGVTHQMVVHEIREQVEVGFLKYLSGEIPNRQYEERVAVDFLFTSSRGGTPSAMLPLDDVIALRDWLTAVIERTAAPDHQAEAVVQRDAKLPGNPADHQAEASSEHDPRCISLTDSEFNGTCDCATLRRIDALDARQEAYRGDCAVWGLDYEVSPESVSNAFFRGYDAALAARPVVDDAAPRVGYVVHSRRAGKTQRALEALLSLATARGIQVEIIEPKPVEDDAAVERAASAYDQMSVPPVICSRIAMRAALEAAALGGDQASHR